MADFYGTVDGYAAYAEARGMDAPAAVDPDDVQAALLVASVWLDGRYGSTFRLRTQKTGGRAQAREWPRAGFVDGSGYPIGFAEVPREVEHATYEAAFRQLLKPGALHTDFSLAKSYKRVAIDGALSVEFAGASSATDAQMIIPIVDQILSPLLFTSGGVVSSSNVGSRVRV